MELRELRGDDLFTIMSILNKLKIDEALDDLDIKSLAGDSDESKQELGMTVIKILTKQLLRNLPSVKEDLNSLLADLTGKKPDYITSLSMKEYVGLIVKLVKSPEFKEVFTSAVSEWNSSKK